MPENISNLKYIMLIRKNLNSQCIQVNNSCKSKKIENQKRTSTTLSALPRKQIANKKEIKNIYDKHYQMQMIDIIEKYFQQEELLSVLINKKLKPMTIKIFVDLINTLLKIIGLEDILTVKNYIEQLPKLSTLLHYPGFVNRSWLKTINTIHSWPNILGWLSWLVIICKIKSKADTILQVENLNFTGISFATKNRKKTIFKLILSCNRSYNEGDSVSEQKLIRDYLKNEEKIHGASEENVYRLKTLLIELESQCQSEKIIFNQAIKENENLKQSLHFIKLDRSVFDRFLEVGAYDLTEIENYNITINSELAILEYAIEEKSANIGCLEDILQEHESMVSRKSDTMELFLEYESAIKNLDQNLIKLNEQNLTLKQTIQGMNENLNCVMNSYEKYFENMKINFKNYSDIDLIKILNKNEQELVNLSNNMVDKCHKLENEIERKKLELQLIQEKSQKYNIEKTITMGLQEKYEKEIKEIKQKMNDTECDFENKIDELKLELKEIQKINPDLNLSNSELSKANKKFQILKNRQKELKYKMKTFFANLLKEKFKRKI